MRRIEEIKYICKRLYHLWKIHPKLQLGQIISVLASNKEGTELYDLTDEQILVEIEREIQKDA